MPTILRVSPLIEAQGGGGSEGTRSAYRCDDACAPESCSSMRSPGDDVRDAVGEGPDTGRAGCTRADMNRACATDSCSKWRSPGDDVREETEEADMGRAEWARADMEADMTWYQGNGAEASCSSWQMSTCDESRWGLGRAFLKGGGGRKGFVTPTETNVHGDALCFMVIGPSLIQRLAVGGWRLATVGGGWCLAVAGCWLVVVGGWRLAAVGSWRLLAVGGWRLAVGGP